MKIWFTLERNNGKWTVWQNSEKFLKTHGGCGCRGIFSSESKKECLKFCEEHKIKLKKGM